MDGLLNKSDDLDVGLVLASGGAVEVVTVDSDMDLLVVPPKKLLSVDLRLEGVPVGVKAVDVDVVVVIMGSEVALGVVAIDALPEDNELYVPDLDEAAAVALAIISAIISISDISLAGIIGFFSLEERGV